MEREVIVVGGGAIGLACAWRLSQRGLSVTVLERDGPGSGATRASAGMLAPVTETEFGDERLLELALAGAEAWPGFAEDLRAATGIDCGYRRTGALYVALDRDELEEVRRHHDFRSSLGLRAEWLSPSRCRELEPGLSPSCTGGAFSPEDGEVDPRTLTAALVAALGRGGVQVLQREVVALEPGEGVLTGDGNMHRAHTVVYASGAWSEWLPEEARPPVRPVKGQILRLRAREPVCERIVRTPEVYIVPRATGEVVVGATVEERGFDTTVTAGAVYELLREAYRALPDLAEVELTEASAGLRPATPDNLPLIGPSTLDGLVLATGHYRKGILLTPTTADAVAEAVVSVAA